MRTEFEAFPAAQQRPVLEHGDGLWVERPISPLARSIRPPGHFDEAVVKAEVVPERVLPPLGVFAVIRKVVHDELVDVGQG